MSVVELHGERTLDFGITAITGKRVFRMTWAERFSADLPVFNESHPDASINSSLEKCRVIRKVVDEWGGTDGTAPTHAKVTVEYSTRPTGTVSITADTISFADTNPDTILDSGSGFINAGFKDGLITVTGSVNNDGSYTIDTSGVAAGVLTLIGGDALVTEAAGALVTITQKNAQIVRSFEMGAQVVMKEADGSYSYVSAPTDKVSKPFSVIRNQGVLTVTKAEDSFPFATVKSLIGKLNNASFYGEAAETFLFMGTSVREDVDDSGDSTWVTDYRFQYDAIGWNKIWHPNLSGGADFDKIVDTKGNNPYALGDFSTLDVEPAA